MGIRPILASILSFSNSDNKRIVNSVEKLRAMDLEGVCCVKFRICLST
jgi:intracellular multiplication protein IcmB